MNSKTNDPVSFARDIQPLFRPKDVNAMKGYFDLSKYEDVRDNAEDIHAVLKDGSMPCDGAWAVENVEEFANWIEDGKQP